MIHRRQLLLGSLAAALPGAASATPPSPAPPAKHLIVLWMQGGASHIDTFDPKSGHVDAGPFRSIPTKTPGLAICEHLPQLAERSDDYAVIRSMTSKEGNHERARHLGHTGYPKNPTVAHPSLASWLVHDAPASELPRFVSLLGPAHGAGFLGVQHGPLLVPTPGQPPAHVAYGFGVDEARFRRREHALAFVDDRFSARVKASAQRSRRQVFDRATALMHSDELGAFSLEEEPLALRQAYGDSPFGRACLQARRLVEAGVRVVEVTLDGWDTHADNFERTRGRMEILDPAMATLLADLRARDLLRETLVLWMGDFGRSPRINGRDGRDHHPRAWSAVLAGGGVRGGVVHGATDERGAEVVADPVEIPDLFATVARQMGVSPSLTKLTPSGRPLSLTDHGSIIPALLSAP